MSDINFTRMFPSPETLVTYINSGSPLNIMDQGTDTLLMYVCTQILQSNITGWVNVAMKMLDFTPERINLGYANSEGITALILVSGVDNDVALKILKHTDVEVNLNSVEQNNSMNALMYACTQDTEDVALKMLEFPSIVISLQHVNKNNYTPLMIACEEGLNEIALSMIDWFPTDKLNILQKNNSGKNAFDLALDSDLDEVYRILGQMMDEEERNDNMYSNNNNEIKGYEWAEGQMPMIPSYPEQVIDTSKNGYDAVMIEERNVKEYIDEDKDNIVILYEGTNYLLSRSTIERQMEDGIVFECLLAGGDKNPSNIVQNLPLFNIKMIGIDMPTDKTGIWPEFIYLDGIKNIVSSKEQYFSVIALVDKMLVSVISLNEAKKWGTALAGTAAGSLHCQNGQGGMAGIIVLANPILAISGGKRKKRGTMKKSGTMKKKKYSKKTQKRYRKNRK
jgi:hypothetical protein